MIGWLIHACNATFEDPLHYRTLKRNKDRNLKMNNDNYVSLIICSDESLMEIKWWCDNLQKLNGKPIRSRPVDIWVEGSLHRIPLILHIRKGCLEESPL